MTLEVSARHVLVGFVHATCSPCGYVPPWPTLGRHIAWPLHLDHLRARATLSLSPWLAPVIQQGMASIIMLDLLRSGW